MNKKLLLSTVMSGTILFSSYSNAAIREFSFDGANQFSFEGRNFNGLDALTTFLQTPGAFDPNVDDLKMNDATQRAFFNAMKVNGSGEREGFVRSIASSHGKDVNEVRNFVDQAVNVVNTMEILDPSFDPLSVMDFNDLMEADLDEITEVIDYGKTVVQNGAIISEADTSFTNLENQLAIANPEINNLVSEKNSLASVPNKTNEQNQRIKEISTQILAKREFAELRNSSQVQETLKARVANISELFKAEFNDKLILKAAIDIESFRRDMDKYLVSNPTEDSLLPDVQKPDNPVLDAMIDSLIVNRSIIDSRVGDLVGVASGDEAKAYGFWAKGSLTRAKQKARGNAQGYELDRRGVTLGMDIGEDSLVGIAYSFFKNDVKNTEIKANKEDVVSHTIAAYAKHQTASGIFVSGQTQFGSGIVKKERATGDAANNIATAKTRANILGAKADLGYDMNFSSFRLIPSVGVAYSGATVEGYKESGKGLNREIEKTYVDRVSGILGMSAKYFLSVDRMKLVPEIHANIDYALKAKDGATIVKITEGIIVTTPIKKAEKMRYNLGGSMQFLLSEALEFMAGYDFDGAKNFQSHTGTLKVKLNF
jgi:uncharacterized protein with beta-barrel porin domain